MRDLNLNPEIDESLKDVKSYKTLLNCNIYSI